MNPGTWAANDPSLAPVLESAVDRLYQNRFPQPMHQRRNAVWGVLCRCWLGRYISSGDRVLEIGAGYCEFINNIDAGEKVALDLNPQTRQYSAPGVAVYQAAAEEVAGVVPADHFDAAFMSNFLEHCRSRDQVLAVLRGTFTVLRPGGRVLILGPNFRYCFRDYYDYFDHHLPLTEQAVAEALRLCGFELEVVQPRTLPFSFRSKTPSWPWLVRLYLHLPWAWRFFGAQFFLVARKPAATAGPALFTPSRDQAA
jgi:SAM-dependent methyltransferase